MAPPFHAAASYAELDDALAELDDALLWLTLVAAGGQKLAGARIIARGVGAEAVERVRLDFEARFHGPFPAAVAASDG